jgi:hypothetical protein
MVFHSSLNLTPLLSLQPVSFTSSCLNESWSTYHEDLFLFLELSLILCKSWAIGWGMERLFSKHIDMLHGLTLLCFSLLMVTPSCLPPATYYFLCSLLQGHAVAARACRKHELAISKLPESFPSFKDRASHLHFSFPLFATTTAEAPHHQIHPYRSTATKSISPPWSPSPRTPIKPASTIPHCPYHPSAAVFSRDDKSTAISSSTWPAHHIPSTPSCAYFQTFLLS